MENVNRWFALSTAMQCVAVACSGDWALLTALPVLPFAIAWRKRWRYVIWACFSHYLAWAMLEFRTVPRFTLFLAAIAFVTAAGLIQWERRDPRPIQLWIFR
jgi:hypothetical protein